MVNEDRELVQIIADLVQSILIERNLENNHDNRVMITREVLDNAVAEGLCSSYTWIGDNIRIMIAKN